MSGRHSIIIGVALALGGCGPSSYALPPEWAPLTEVVERPRVGLDDGTTTTVGTRILVADLRAWQRRYPEGSVERDALLRHEREHAIRQQGRGLGPWLRLYLNDRDFMWAEEQRGWYLELRRLQAAGRPIVPAEIAARLSRYRNLAGRMVSFRIALAWVQDVLAGRWTPEAPRG